MSHHNPLKKIRFDPPDAGWMTCVFSTKHKDRTFDISDAVNDPLAMFKDMLDALRHGREVPVVELFLEPEWVLVTYDRACEELTIAHESRADSFSCDVSSDELAYFISMGLKRLNDECAGKMTDTDWSYPLPTVTL